MFAPIKSSELNRATGTGSLYDAIFTETPQLHGAAHNEMTAIQSRLGPSQRIQGSGSSSDRDVSLFMRGLPNTNNPGPVNKAIREDYERQYIPKLRITFLQEGQVPIERARINMDNKPVLINTKAYHNVLHRVNEKRIIFSWSCTYGKSFSTIRDMLKQINQ